MTDSRPSTDEPAVAGDSSFMSKPLYRLCTGERVARFLQKVCADKAIYVEVVSADESPISAFGIPFPPETKGTVTDSSYVVFREWPIASVRVWMVAGNPEEVADWIAHYLSELLDLEDVVASLTTEVVHSYEELHLLYSLGEALGGVLDLEAACHLIVRSTVGALGAAQASLRLFQLKGHETIVSLTNTDGEADVQNPRARIAAPLIVNGESIGEIMLEGKIDATEFSSGDSKLLVGVAAVAAPAIRSAQLYQVARRQADTDGLTGLINHRCLQERIDEVLSDADRNESSASIIIADLDSFKLFNDVYGHPVGDRVLRTVSACLRETVRTKDIVGRYGGDEFLLVLPHTDMEDALMVGRRVIGEVEKCEIDVQGDSLPLRLSLGIATFPKDGRSKHELIAHADAALYESKNAGGGRLTQVNTNRSDWMALQGSSYTALEGLVNSVDAKDHYTRTHSEVVTEAALILADALHLSDESRRALRIAGLLHDIGKIGIPDQILKKPGKLTADEYSIMKQHVQLSEMMIKNIPYLNDVLDAVAHHHERFDGHGYPYQKTGDDIPLLGRIMALADAFSAMSLDRPYRKGMNWQQIREELKSGSGSQFDPDLVPTFIEAMETVGNDESVGRRWVFGA
ncbi:MAG: diguanylate cyclase [Caldilineaceae bacterium]|nr:diguanylate cyclase [Caldilineaceae bacterium]